jgi:hypothetical protein
MVIPPDESLHLASEADDLATLVWYAEGGHCLYEEMSDWMDLTGSWILGLTGHVADAEASEPATSANTEQARNMTSDLDVDSPPVETSTRVDSTPGEDTELAGQANCQTISGDDESEDDPDEFDVWS